MFKIVRTDAEQEVCFKALEEVARVVHLPEFGTSEDDLVQECKDADLILHCYTPITRRVIENAQRLKGIIKYGVGIDAIDIDAAKQRGIPVANIPDYGDQTVAEGAFYLMITLAKNGQQVQRLMRRDGWVWPKKEVQGLDLGGKTVGLVGCGKIGKRFARMAKGFGMRVICFDPYRERDQLEQVDSLNRLCERSDFISIHATLNESSRNLIRKEHFLKMKPTAYLINTSRGGIVDEQALVHAVESHQIAGVGLDTYSVEPLHKESHVLSSLFDRDNVVLTPHFAFWTKEAAQRLQQETLERCFEIINKQSLVVKSDDPRLTSQTQNVVVRSKL